MAAAEIDVPIEFSVSLTTDPLGGTLDATIPTAPLGEDARQALLDDVETKVVGERNNLVFQAVQLAHEQLGQYGRENDYRTGPIEESFAGVDTDRNRTSIHAEWYWEHQAAKFMEFGTSDHTVEGDPLLVFAFDAAEYPGLAELFPGGTAFLPEVEVSGLPEARWVRDSLNWLRREVRR